MTGYGPTTCPWQSLSDPLVQDVVTLRSLRESDAFDAYLGDRDRTPRRLIEAYAHFTSSVSAAQAHDMRVAEARRERERKVRK